MMTEMETTNNSIKSSTPFVCVRRLLALAGTIACGLAVLFVAWHQPSSSRPGLRNSTYPTFESWASFNRQATSLGHATIEVEQVDKNSSGKRGKVMEIKDSHRTELLSTDEEVIVQIIEHKDPDLSESGTDEFKFEFEGDFDKHDLEAALSKALKSGLRDSDQIAKAVSENLKHRKNKSHRLPENESLKDKP